MMVAKFKVTQVIRRMGSRRDGDKYVLAEIQNIEMDPVVGESDENKAFWEATPTGKINIGVLNQEVWNHFELEEEVYVYFSKEKL